jgi:hypothetical protein
MNLIVHISLSFLISLQSIGFSIADIVKVSELYEHYEYHQEEYGHDLLTFFDLHYGEQKDAHQEDHKGHDELPCHHTSISINILFLDSPKLDIDRNLVFEKADVPSTYQTLISFHYIDEILHPPKV